MSFIKSLNYLLNIFLQSNCLLCHRSTQDNNFCFSCAKQLQKCQVNDPRSQWSGKIPVFAWGRYEGMLKRAIGTMKYSNKAEIARPLGQFLGESWLQSTPVLTKKMVVVPIPLHPEKQKQRGFNQAELIAEGFCETTGLKLKANGLQRVLETQAQHSLSSVERQKNLQGAFRLGCDLQRHPNASVLLLDDIYTTGSTAHSSAITLRQAGISVIGIATTAISMKVR